MPGCYGEPRCSIGSEFSLCASTRSRRSVSVGPDMRSGFALDQLHIDLTRSPSGRILPSRTYQTPRSRAICLASTGLPPQMKAVLRVITKLPRDPRQIGRQIIGNHIREILLVWIVRQVDQGKDHDRQTRHCRAGDGWRRLRARCRRRLCRDRRWIAVRPRHQPAAQWQSRRRCSPRLSPAVTTASDAANWITPADR